LMSCKFMPGAAICRNRVLRGDTGSLQEPS
jgi:hypothetical protein